MCILPVGAVVDLCESLLLYTSDFVNHSRSQLQIHLRGHIINALVQLLTICCHVCGMSNGILREIIEFCCFTSA